LPIQTVANGTTRTFRDVHFQAALGPEAVLREHLPDLPISLNPLTARRKRGIILCMNDPNREGHMASHIARRKFRTALGDAAAAWPLVVPAQ